MAIKSTARRTHRGRLRIGDQWNAINIIAHSQTHPLKAVCELTENAIDARASLIHIVRRRRQGRIFLEVIDDGLGISLNEEGQPDFDHIATHICDSMKRHLDQQERHGIHGEFGIGLLSFWSLGHELRMTSAGSDNRLHEMTLKQGGRSYTVRPVRGELATGGTRVVVGPLLETTRKLVTGDKLQRHLSAELRDRMRNTGVQIRVTDRVSRKDLIVKPREFEGDRLEEISKVSTSFGEVLVELYVQPANGRNRSAVAICKDGTRVVQDISTLTHFQHSPWTDGRLEGMLDFAALNLAPGMRSGIVPDECFQVFVNAVTGIEAGVLESIEMLDRAETDRASQKILRQVHKAFQNALRDLPDNEYLFFDIPEPARSLGRRADGGEPPSPPQDGVPLAAGGAQESTAAEQELPAPLPLEPGAGVGIHQPASCAAKSGRTVPADGQGPGRQWRAILEGIGFSWRISAGQGTKLDTDGAQCSLTSQQVGKVTVEVTAIQAARCSLDEVEVKFLEHATDDDRDSSQGLPSYRLEAEHGKSWRFRYDAPQNEIIINAAHRDFLLSKVSAAKHRRYIGKLYAKEVVLINFPHETSADVMERLIEVLVRTEDAL